MVLMARSQSTHDLIVGMHARSDVVRKIYFAVPGRQMEKNSLVLTAKILEVPMPGEGYTREYARRGDYERSRNGFRGKINDPIRRAECHSNTRTREN